MKKLLCLVVISLLLTSCATMFGGNTTTINLQPSILEHTTPVKVQIKNKGKFQTITLPGSATVKNSFSSVEIKVKDKCFRETTNVIRSRPSFWILLNTFNFLTGMTTDAFTGAMWTFDDTSLVIHLEPNGVCR